LNGTIILGVLTLAFLISLVDITILLAGV